MLAWSSRYHWTSTGIDTINAYRLGDVLEFSSAKILEIDLDLALDLPVGILR